MAMVVTQNADRLRQITRRFQQMRPDFVRREIYYVRDRCTSQEMNVYTLITYTLLLSTKV